MDRLSFISKIKNIAIELYNKHNIIPSLTLAQAILESKNGESDLVIQGNNLFGIKWNENCGYDKISILTKEFIDNQYVNINANFRKYSSWEDSIYDHIIFLKKERYKNIIGDSNYKSVCKKIYEDGYATDPNYPLKLIKLIEEYNLNKYDNKQGGNNMSLKIAIDPGHGCYPDTGAEGCLNEQNCALDMSNRVISKLKNLGHEAWNVRPSSASSVTSSLQQRCDNASNADYLISIHMNASDGNGHGSEVFAMSSNGKELAQRIQNQLVNLGWTDRGVKDGSRLYIIRHSSPVSCLVEICFCDNSFDTNLYNSLGADTIATAIVKGITEQTSTYNDSSSDFNCGSRLLLLASPLMYGQDIMDLQNKLNKLGYNIDIDGYYGQNTYAAVVQAQSNLGVSADGIVGNSTLNAINSAIEKNNNKNIKEEKKVKNIVCVNNYVDLRAGSYLADFLQCPIIDNNLVKFDYTVVENVYCVGGGEFTSYAKKIIKGADRYDTCQAVLDFIKNK